jgi:protein AroM
VTRRLGVLTIGQSPRADGLGRDVQQIVGPEVEVVERGALDGLATDEIAALGPRPGEYLLISMLADGSSTRMGRERLLPLVQQRIDELEGRDRVDATLLVCNGAFPPFRHARPLVIPQEALLRAVIGLAGGERIGVLAPLPEQVAPAERAWRALGATDLVVVPAGPYSADPATACREGAAAAADAGARLLFLDGFANDRAMQEAARSAFAGPVLRARSLAARLLAEIVG